MAHKKAGGSTTNGRNSPGQRLGIKRFGGQLVKAGEVLVRQVGTKFHAGLNVGKGKDHTLFALKTGQVNFSYASKLRQVVSVVPASNPA